MTPPVTTESAKEESSTKPEGGEASPETEPATEPKVTDPMGAGE